MHKQFSSYWFLAVIVLYIFFGDKLPFDFLEVGLVLFVVFIMTKAIEKRSQLSELTTKQKLLISFFILLLILVTAGVLKSISGLLLFFELKSLVNFGIASILFVMWCFLALKVSQKVIKGLHLIIPDRG